MDKTKKYILIGVISIVVVIATILTCTKKDDSKNKQDSYVNETETIDQTASPTATNSDTNGTQQNDNSESSSISHTQVDSNSNMSADEAAKTGTIIYETLPDDSTLPEGNMTGEVDTTSDDYVSPTYEPDKIDTSKSIIKTDVTDFDSFGGTINSTMNNLSENYNDVSRKMYSWKMYDINNNNEYIKVEDRENLDGLYYCTTGTSFKKTVTIDETKYNRNYRVQAQAIIEVNGSTVTLHTLIVGPELLLDDGAWSQLYG